MLLHQIPQNTAREFTREGGSSALGSALYHFLAGSGAGSGFLTRNLGGNGVGGRWGYGLRTALSLCLTSLVV